MLYRFENFFENLIQTITRYVVGVFYITLCSYKQKNEKNMKTIAL